MRRLVTLGNAVVDVVARVPTLPARGADVLAEGGAEPGGGGLRVLVAAQDAGLPAAFAGRIGSGPFGDLLRAALQALGIPALLPAVDGTDSGFAITLLEADGERTFLTVPGAEQAPPLLADLRLRPDDLVHVSGYALQRPERARAVVGFVRGLPDGVLVLLDPGPLGLDPGRQAALLERADWWSGNAREAAAATGRDDPVAAVRLLATATRRGAVVRLGADGCLVAESGEEPVAVPAPAVTAVDTNGAGDTHVGAFLAALAAGDRPLRAAELANAAAARFVARPSREVESARAQENAPG